MNISSRLLVTVVGALSIAMSLPASSPSPLALPRSTPEAQGIASSALRGFIDAADQQVETMNSVMLVRHGSVVAEGWWTPYAAETPHMLYSLSKSFTSTAVGLAIADGKLSLDDEVLKFFPDDAPSEPATNLKAMRVRDLLTMSAGHQVEAKLSASDQPWTRTFLAHPVPHKPGTHFLYNTPATYIASAVVQKVTGQTVLDFLQPRLFGPLGIEHPVWGTSPQGISLGGYGLSIRTEDIAKFGQLLLQKGRWHGKALVPETWLEMATARQVSNGSNPKSDWEQGYGFQFWRCRHGAFRGDGAFGQYCLVMPEQDAVLAITSGTKDMQSVLNLVWDKLLPAMKSTPLPANESEATKLKTMLARLSVRMPQGATTSPMVAKLAGRTFIFPPSSNRVDAITFVPGASQEASTLVVRVNGNDHRVACGHGSWQKGRMAFGTLAEQPVAIAANWTDEDTFTAKLCFYETPIYVTLRLKAAGEELLLDSEYNVSFNATKQPQIAGRAAK